MSDFLTGHEYFDGQTFTVSDVKHFNDSKVANLTSSFFFNATTRICNLESTENVSYKFSCTQFHYWYGILTFVFIFAPSGSTLCALIGQRDGKLFSLMWGCLIFFTGLNIAIFTVDDRTALVLGIFMTTFGPFFQICSLNAMPSMKSTKKLFEGKHNLKFFLIVPLIHLLSPIIMVFIHSSLET